MLLGNLVFIILGLALMVAGFWFFNRFRQIEDMPTSKISSAAQGHVELRGTVLSLDQPTYTNHHGQRVVYRKYDVYEEDRSGKNTGLQKGRGAIFGYKFYLEDPSGVVEVYIEDFNMVLPRVIFPYSQLKDEKLPSEHKKIETFFNVVNTVGDITDGTRNKRVYEWSIPVGSKVLLHGDLRSCVKSIQGKTISASIHFHKQRNSFISTKTEKELILADKVKSYSLIALGAGCLYFGIVGKFLN